MSRDVDASPFIEERGSCEEHPDQPHLLIHGADGTHLGFALSLLRARLAEDDAFEQMILDTISEDEMFRSAVELVLNTALNLCADVDETCDDPDCDGCGAGEDDTEALADVAAYGYLTALADLAAFSCPHASLLAHDLAEASLTESTTIYMHRADLDHILSLAANLMRMVGVRYNIDFEEQADLLTADLAKHQPSTD